MAQKRYFEYQSLIKSKTSAESIALAADGIGVVHGFDKVSIDLSTKVFTLSPNGNNIDLTGSTGLLEPVKHACITPDGILTTETSDISLSLSDGSLITQGAYFVLASHQHIESVEAVIPTSYSLIKGDIGIISELTKVNGTVNIRNWYTRLQSIYPEYNANTTVICALIEYNSSSNIKIYTPKNNKWPSDFDYLNTRHVSFYNLMVTPHIISTTFTKLDNYSYTDYKQIDYTDLPLISNLIYDVSIFVRQKMDVEGHINYRYFNFKAPFIRSAFSDNYSYSSFAQFSSIDDNNFGGNAPTFNFFFGFNWSRLYNKWALFSNLVYTKTSSMSSNIAEWNITYVFTVQGIIPDDVII